MSFEQMDSEDFYKLPIPPEQWRLDLLLKSGPHAKNARRKRGFETPEACWAEDERRARELWSLPKEIYHGVEGCDAGRLGNLINRGAVAKRTLECAASAAYTRDRRLALLGSILQLVDVHRDQAAALITVSHAAWYFALRYQWRLMSEIPQDLEELVNGQLDSPTGFSILFLSGHYNTAANNFQVTLKGICTGDKLREFRRLTDERNEATSRMWQIGICDIRNLPRQLCAMMPNAVNEVGTWQENGKLLPACRMREPYHSIYLMWLDQYLLSDFVFVDGVTVKGGGGLVLQVE